MPTTRKPQPRRKIVYHVRNWKAYDRALVQRGSLTLWIDEDVRRQWHYTGPAQRGAQFTYSDLAVEAMLSLKEVFHLPNRATEGLGRSLMELLGVDLDVPDHTTLSRRGKTLRVRLPKKAHGPLQLVLDSTGLKVYGEGEWKVRQHGYSKRRTWRKVHLSVDAASSEIQAVVFTEAGVHDAQAAAALLAQVESALTSVSADGAYDRTNVYRTLTTHSPAVQINIPPRRDAKIQQHGNVRLPPLPRDENLRQIRQHGRAHWKHTSGYHRRSLAETAMFRLKTIFGDHLSCRRLDTQASQVGIRCRVLNRLIHLGKPQSYKVD
jgi:DDE family transposase